MPITQKNAKFVADMMKRLLTLGITIGLAVPMLAQQLPAFPGADGYGRYTSGGRGGWFTAFPNSACPRPLLPTKWKS